MTEYIDRVEARRLELELEQYCAGVSYIQANGGVIETKYNNGDIKFEKRLKNGKYRTSWKRENASQATLLDRFKRAVADRRY